jgi:son of sevenless
MTYKSFTTVDELFDLLVKRFRIQPPPNLTPQELSEWGKLKQRLIQIRYACNLYFPTIIDFFSSVLNTLKAMITDEDVFDKEDMSVLERMLEFLKSDDVSHLNAAISLKGNVERIVRSCCFM